MEPPFCDSCCGRHSLLYCPYKVCNECQYRGHPISSPACPLRGERVRGVNIGLRIPRLPDGNRGPNVCDVCHVWGHRVQTCSVIVCRICNRKGHGAFNCLAREEGDGEAPLTESEEEGSDNERDERDERSIFV